MILLRGIRLGSLILKQQVSLPSASLSMMIKEKYAKTFSMFLHTII